MPKRAKSYAKPHWHDTRGPKTRRQISNFESHYIEAASHDHAIGYGKQVNRHFGHHPEANFHEDELNHHTEWWDKEPNLPGVVRSQIHHSTKHWKNMPKDTVLHRGVNAGEVAHMEEGKSYHMRPLLSTAAGDHGRKTAIGFAKNSAYHDPRHLHILEFHGVEGKHTFTGVHASQEHFGNEHEVVLAGNSTPWKVHKIETVRTKVRNGWTHSKVLEGDDGKYHHATKKMLAAHNQIGLQLNQDKQKDVAEHRARLAKHYGLKDPGYESTFGRSFWNHPKISDNDRYMHEQMVAMHHKRINEHDSKLQNASRPKYTTMRVTKYLVHPAEKEAHLIPTLAKAAVTVAKKV